MDWYESDSQVSCDANTRISEFRLDWLCILLFGVPFSPISACARSVGWRFIYTVWLSDRVSNALSPRAPAGFFQGWAN